MWWCLRDMETLFALLAFCTVKPPVTSGFLKELNAGNLKCYTYFQVQDIACILSYIYVFLRLVMHIHVCVTEQSNYKFIKKKLISLFASKHLSESSLLLGTNCSKLWIQMRNVSMQNGFENVVYKYDSILINLNVLNIFIIKPEYSWIARSKA